MSESVQTTAVDEHGANRQRVVTDEQGTSETANNSRDQQYPPSEYSLGRQTVDELAAAGFEGYVCVVDGGKLKLAAFESSEPNARAKALRQAKRFYDSEGISWYDYVRVYQIKGFHAYRTAFFSVRHKYRDEEFEHEHTNRDRAYVLELGPANPTCTIRFGSKIAGLSDPLGGCFLGRQLTYTCEIQLHVTVQLVAPESWDYPPCEFAGSIKFRQYIDAYGPDEDPRDRIVRFLSRPEWSLWRYGPMFEEGGRRKSIWPVIKESWPGFHDKSLLRELRLHFRASIEEWLLRNLFDCALGVNAPCLRRSQFRTYSWAEDHSSTDQERKICDLPPDESLAQNIAASALHQQ